MYLIKDHKKNLSEKNLGPVNQTQYSWAYKPTPTDGAPEAPTTELLEHGSPKIILPNLR